MGGKGLRGALHRPGWSVDGAADLAREREPMMSGSDERQPTAT